MAPRLARVRNVMTFFTAARGALMAPVSMRVRDVMTFFTAARGAH